MANSKSFNQSENLSDENIPQNQDLNFNQTEKVPITRACQKLIVYRNASQLALLFLEEEMNEEIIWWVIFPLINAPSVNGNWNAKPVYQKINSEK